MVSAYQPPNTSVKKFQQDYEKLIKKLGENKNCDVIIGLDHNLDFIKCNSHIDTQKFLEFNLDSNLLPCIIRPTRITKSTATLIDNLFISKNTQGKQDSKILISDINNLLPSLVTLNGPFLEKRQNQTIVTRKLTEQMIHEISNILASHVWSNDLVNEDINVDFDLFHDRLISSLDKFAPECKITLNKRQTKRDPWIIPSLLKSFTKQCKYYKEALKHKGNQHHWKKYKLYKSILDKIKRYLKMTFYHNKCLEFKHNSKKLWTMINNISGKTNDKTTLIDSVKVDNIEYFDAFGVTNNLCKYFYACG